MYSYRIGENENIGIFIFYFAFLNFAKPEAGNLD